MWENKLLYKNEKTLYVKTVILSLNVISNIEEAKGIVSNQ